jgi:hypothetical protein
MQTRVTIWPDVPEDHSWLPPLRHHWRKAVASDSLIPLDLAIMYFRKPDVWIDARISQPTISTQEPIWNR